MRKSLSILITIAIIIAILPFTMGILAKHQIQARLDTLSSISNLSLKFQVQDYHQGWLHSSTKIVILPANPQLAKIMQKVNQENKQPAKHISELIPFYFQAEITHGPLVFFKVNDKQHIRFTTAVMNYHMMLRTTPSDQAQIKKYLGNQNLLSGTTMLNFDGSSRTKLNSAKIAYENPAMNINWEGMDGSWYLSSGHNNVRADIYVQPINVTLPDFSLVTSPITLTSELKKAKHNYWYGNSKIVLDSLIVKRANNNWLTVRGLQARNDRHVNNGKVDGIAQWKLAKLSLAGANYGPAKLHVALKNINIKEFQNVITKLQAMDPNNVSQAQQAMQVIELIPQAVRALNGASFEQDLQASTPSGELKTNIKISMPQIPEEQVTMAGLLAGLQAQLNLQIPKPLLLQLNSLRIRTKLQALAAQQQRVAAHRAAQAIIQPPATEAANQTKAMSAEQIKQNAQERAKQQIAVFEQSGYLASTDDGTYQVNISYKKGKLSINGKPFSFTKPS